MSPAMGASRRPIFHSRGGVFNVSSFYDSNRRVWCVEYLAVIRLFSVVGSRSLYIFTPPLEYLVTDKGFLNTLSTASLGRVV
jgi:hypothetical protein